MPRIKKPKKPKKTKEGGMYRLGHQIGLYVTGQAPTMRPPSSASLQPPGLQDPTDVFQTDIASPAYQSEQIEYENARKIDAEVRKKAREDMLARINHRRSGSGRPITQLDTGPLTGSGMSAPLLKEFIDLSYRGNTSIAPAGWSIDAPLSDSRVKVYAKNGSNDKDIVVTHRGSVGLDDWMDNASYMFRGKVKGTKTYNLHRDRHKRAIDKYGASNITAIGHSRAGLYLQELQKEFPIKENITYNKASGFHDIGRQNDANQTDVRVGNDIVSLLAPLQRRNNAIVNISGTKNPFDFNAAHQTAEINKVGDQYIGKGRKRGRPRKIGKGDNIPTHSEIMANKGPLLGGPYEIGPSAYPHLPPRRPRPVPFQPKLPPPPPSPLTDEEVELILNRLVTRTKTPVRRNQLEYYIGLAREYIKKTGKAPTGDDLMMIYQGTRPPAILTSLQPQPLKQPLTPQEIDAMVEDLKSKVSAEDRKAIIRQIADIRNLIKKTGSIESLLEMYKGNPLPSLPSRPSSSSASSTTSVVGEGSGRKRGRPRKVGEGASGSGIGSSKNKVAPHDIQVVFPQYPPDRPVQIHPEPAPVPPPPPIPIQPRRPRQTFHSPQRKKYSGKPSSSSSGASSSSSGASGSGTLPVISSVEGIKRLIATEQARLRKIKKGYKYESPTMSQDKIEEKIARLKERLKSAKANKGHADVSYFIPKSIKWLKIMADETRVGSDAYNKELLEAVKKLLAELSGKKPTAANKKKTATLEEDRDELERLLEKDAEKPKSRARVGRIPRKKGYSKKTPDANKPAPVIIPPSSLTNERANIRAAVNRQRTYNKIIDDKQQEDFKVILKAMIPDPEPAQRTKEEIRKERAREAARRQRERDKPSGFTQAQEYNKATKQRQAKAREYGIPTREYTASLKREAQLKKIEEGLEDEEKKKVIREERNKLKAKYTYLDEIMNSDNTEANIANTASMGEQPVVVEAEVEPPTAPLAGSGMCGGSLGYSGNDPKYVISGKNEEYKLLH
jgi:hypothetical protein